MPSQAMQNLIDALRDRQKAGASQAPSTLEERRAAFAPAGRLHPVPDDMLVTEATTGGVPAYLAGADPKTPLASPLFASFVGLPPLLVQAGTADLLLSNSERLASAAAEAGVDVTLQAREGQPHVYQILLGTPEAAEASEEIVKFLGSLTRQSRGLVLRKDEPASVITPQPEAPGRAAPGRMSQALFQPTPSP